MIKFAFRDSAIIRIPKSIWKKMLRYMWQAIAAWWALQ